MKKRVIQIVLVAAFVFSLFIPAVQTFAVSALSVFRVGDTKTITITMVDIEEMAAYLQKHEELFRQMEENNLLDECAMNAEKVRMERPDTTQLADVSEFKAFSIKLPPTLQDETPQLYAMEAGSLEFALDIAAKNEILAQLGDAPLFDSALDGTNITFRTPPVLVADYGERELIIAATQMVYVEAARSVQESLRDTILEMPFITSNLREQLAAVPLDNRDVYLPVIAGFGREVSVGDTTGYIYTTEDLEVLFGQMPVELFPFNEMSLQKDDDFNGSVLIWSRDGVLYLIAGTQSDNELTRLARSMN